MEITLDHNTAMTAASSVMNPQNFHNKLDFPSFEGCQEQDYQSFKRKWNTTVATAYPDSVQKGIIQDKVPKEIEPEVMKAESMVEVWKILDARYGQPDSLWEANKRASRHKV